MINPDLFIVLPRHRLQESRRYYKNDQGINQTLSHPPQHPQSNLHHHISQTILKLQRTPKEALPHPNVNLN
jgi:hypothetical protein